MPNGPRIPDAATTLAQAAGLETRDIDATGGEVVDTYEFQGFIVWSDEATIAYEVVENSNKKGATAFLSKTVPGGGRIYPLSGRNMTVTGLVTLALR